MTINEAIKYNPMTDGMTDAVFVAKWADAEQAKLVAQGHTVREASSLVDDMLVAIEDL